MFRRYLENICNRYEVFTLHSLFYYCFESRQVYCKLLCVQLIIYGINKDITIITCILIQYCTDVTDGANKGYQ
jgi:hypothetical protein